MTKLSVAVKGASDSGVSAELEAYARRISATPPGMCPVASQLTLLETGAAQTCGKCVPCRDGLPQLASLVRSILDCRATAADLDRARVLAEMIRDASDCAIGYEAAAQFLAGLKAHADEYASHIENHACTEGVMSMSNMAMVCGKLGKPGCGVNPLRGQNNVQGACDMGAGPADFTGYQKVANPDVLAKFETAWGVKMNRTPGLMATECFPAMIDGRIKALFLFGEDPVRTDPDTHHVIRALESLDFLVVEELFMTETAKYADVILPGRSYAEKEGTFTSTERRVQRVRKAVKGPDGPRLDTEVFAEIMRRMGYDQPSLSASQIMEEIASLTPSYAGISHARLDGVQVAGRGIQWPCPSEDHPGTAIMHVGQFSRGKGGYSLAQYRPSAELPNAEYPLMLMTGRVLAQYNACAMTGRTEGLNEIAGESFIELNSLDAEQLGVADGDRVRVSSRRGEIETTARVSSKTNPGQTWMPFHFQDGNSNWLTNAALDPTAKVPEYKVCAVKVEAI